MSNAPTFCHVFQETAASNPDGIALRTLGDAVSITWSEYADRVRTIATGLAHLGVRSGDTVALMLTNRPEFHLVDTAAFHLGAAPFSVYNTNPVETIRYLFGNAENRIVVCEKAFVPILLEAQAAGSKVEHIVCVDGAVDGTISLEEVEAGPAPEFDFDATWRAVRPDDLLTIVYTSGTTGTPKGVELTHASTLVSARATINADLGPRARERVLSYLPDAHVANRLLAHYVAMVQAAEVTDIANPRDVLAGLIEARPHVFFGVPQTWYKLRNGIESAVAAEPDQSKRKTAAWAFEIGMRKVRVEQSGEQPDSELLAQYAEADRLVLAPLRARLGLDALRTAASGAAPVTPESHEFMMMLGIPVREVYGMTESSAIATTHPSDDIRVGTVGVPYPEVEVTLAEDGELLIRGPVLMRGYRKEAQKTAEAIDTDGWLHTGDIATIDDGHIVIVDRKKDLIINASGKNMSPTHIENAVLGACPLAGMVVAIADHRPFVSLLVVLDPDAAAVFAAQHNLSSDITTLASHSFLRDAVRQGIDLANAKLSRAEQVRAFTVVPEYWQPGSDVLTPTMKLRRKPVGVRYAAQIAAMYTTEPPAAGRRDARLDTDLEASR